MRTLLNSSFGMASRLESSAKDAVAFLTQNKDRIQLPDRDKRDLAQLHALSNTPLFEIYRNIIRSELTELFFTMDLSAETSGVPTVLSADELSIDGKAIPAAPASMQKIWVNLAPVLGKRQGSMQTIYVKDMPRMMGYYVRGLMCLGYGRAKGMWLNPSQAAFAIESFSMAAAMRLSRAFHLEVVEFKFVQTAFAFHYAKVMGAEGDESAYPVLLNRCGFLGSIAEIQERLKILADKVDGNLYANGLDTVCTALSMAGPARMVGKFSTENFYHMFPVGAVDNISVAIGMDYPPYWVYLMINYASGSKNPVLSSVFNLSVMKTKLKNWADEMTKSKPIYSIG